MRSRVATTLESLGEMMQSVFGLTKGNHLFTPDLSQLHPNSTPDLSQLNPDFTPDLSEFNPDFTPDLSQLNPNFIPDLSQLNPDFTPIQFHQKGELANSPHLEAIADVTQA